MASELILCPDRLRAQAVTAAELSENLCAVLPGPGAAPDRRTRDELDRLCRAVGHAARELSDLSAALAGCALAAEETDAAVARALVRR